MSPVNNQGVTLWSLLKPGEKLVKVHVRLKIKTQFMPRATLKIALTKLAYIIKIRPLDLYLSEKATKC